MAGLEGVKHFRLRLQPIIKSAAGSFSPGLVQLVGAYSDFDLQSRVRNAVLKVLRQYAPPRVFSVSSRGFASPQALPRPSAGTSPEGEGLASEAYLA